MAAEQDVRAMKTKRYFTLSRRKAFQALVEGRSINYGRYFLLCLAAPSIMALLPFSTSFSYTSHFFVLDILIYFFVVSVGVSRIFGDEEDCLSTLKYCVCNYPLVYFFVYIIIKPLPYFLVVFLYVSESHSDNKENITEKYIASDFFNYAEIATNFLLHALTFYIIYKGCKSFRRHRASQSSHLEVVP